MKKRAVKASAVAVAFAFGTGVVVSYVINNDYASAEISCGECYYINCNQVSMTKNEYDLLHNIGFNDYEIEYMSESKFNKLMGMGFITTLKDVKFICESNDETNAGNDAAPSLVQPLRTHITHSTPFRHFETYGNSKVMYTYVSFVKNNSGYQIYVKQNVFWQGIDPSARLTDIIAINYNNSNLRVASYGNQPDIEAHVEYRCRYIYNDSVSDNVDDEYRYEDYPISARNHKLGEYVAYKAQLPKHEVKKDGVILTDYIVVSLEVAFDTNFSDLTGAEIQSYYAHQTKGSSINSSWSLNFSVYPPSIGVSVNIDKENRPEFEQALFRSINITLDEAWLSRC